VPVSTEMEKETKSLSNENLKTDLIQSFILIAIISNHISDSFIVCLALQWKKINSGIIDFVKLILAKIDLKLNWFMFGYIYVKVGWIKNLSVKINSKFKSYNL
jgi:hypothetical protein